MAELTRQEFMRRWRARSEGGRAPRVRVTARHTHDDSFFTEIVEGFVGAIQIGDDFNGTTRLDVCVGGDGRHGNGRWAPAFLGSETTSLGLRRHLEIMVELLDKA